MAGLGHYCNVTHYAVLSRYMFQVFLGEVFDTLESFCMEMEIKKVFFGFPSCQTSEINFFFTRSLY
jgi:hypothetical protein